VVRTLVDRPLAAGRHEFEWTRGGAAIESGLYYLSLDAEGARHARPFVLIE
jgi:hypothetical protein